MKRLVVFLCLIALPLVAALSFTQSRSYIFDSLGRFEKDKPEISLEGVPASVGRSGFKLAARASDAGAGITRIAIELRDGDKLTPLAEWKAESGEKLASAMAEAEITEAMLEDLSSDAVELRVTASDRAFFSNAEEELAQVKVDLKKPYLSVIPDQQNVTQGGAGMVLFEAGDDSQFTSFVRIGDSTFPAHPLRAGDTRQFAALFAVPRLFDSAVDAAEIVVRDVAGNETARRFPLRVKKVNWPEDSITLSKNFVEDKIISYLAPEYYESLENTSAVKSDERKAMRARLRSEDEASYISSFRDVNENYRRALGVKLVEISSSSAPEFLWDAPFAKPMKGAITGRFGEERDYHYQSQIAGYSLHEGLDIASLQGAAVYSTNKGKVLYAGSLGIYGNAVVVDHGRGLSTLYGHLSRIDCNVGDIVDTTTQIAASGATGLAGGDHLHFEMRIAGVPVTPYEWLDYQWIEDHILAKLKPVEGNA